MDKRQRNAAAQARFKARREAEGYIKISLFVPASLRAAMRALDGKLPAGAALVGVVCQMPDGRLQTVRVRG